MEIAFEINHQDVTTNDNKATETNRDKQRNNGNNVKKAETIFARKNYKFNPEWKNRFKWLVISDKLI